MSLITETELSETKMALLETVRVAVVRLESKTEPYASGIMSMLPPLWAASGEEHLMKQVGHHSLIRVQWTDLASFHGSSTGCAPALSLGHLPCTSTDTSSGNSRSNHCHYRGSGPEKLSLPQFGRTIDPRLRPAGLGSERLPHGGSSGALDSNSATDALRECIARASSSLTIAPATTRHGE
jgi:hypothetical protein